MLDIADECNFPEKVMNAFMWVERNMGLPAMPENKNPLHEHMPIWRLGIPIATATSSKLVCYENMLIKLLVEQ